MKKLALFLVLLAICTLAAVSGQESHDAAELVPVQALVIDAERGRITVTADT